MANSQTNHHPHTIKTEPTTKKQKHNTMIPCHPLPSSGFKFEGKSNHHMLCDSPWLSQHGNIFFNGKIILFFILLTITLQADKRAHLQIKGKFLQLFYMLFLHRCIEAMRTNPSYPPIFFLATPPLFSEFIVKLLWIHSWFTTTPWHEEWSIFHRSWHRLLDNCLAQAWLSRICWSHFLRWYLLTCTGWDMMIFCCADEMCVVAR